MRYFIALIILFSMCNASFAAKQVLQYSVPNGWKMAYHLVKGTSELKEYIPIDESLERWTRMLTVQEFKVTSDKMHARDVIDAIFKGSKKKCNFFRARLFPGTEKEGRDIALGLQYCGLYQESGLGEITLVKVIRKNGLFVVQRAWRGAPFGLRDEPIDKHEMNDWFEDMKGVKFSLSS